MTLDDSAAHAIARHAEGSARDALSLLDQAGVLGGQKVDDAAIQALLGAPRSEVQVELADAVAVGDARTTFEVVNRLVQDGQDLRNVTNETLAHFRDLLLVKTAPGQEDLLDIAADGYEGLRIQAEKFSAPELARVIELLLAAQNDMRWTTSPRLSLSSPWSGPPSPRPTRRPRGRWLGWSGSSGSPTSSPGPSRPPTWRRRSRPPRPPPVGVPAGRRALRAETVKDNEKAKDLRRPPRPASEAVPRRSRPRRPRRRCAARGRCGSVDVTMLRRSWPSLLDHLSQNQQPVLRALLESATPASFDGETLELAFPPSFRNNLRQVAARTDKLQAALSDLFGVRPRIEMVTREAHAGGTEPAAAAFVEEVEEPSEEEALKRLKDVLGATPADEPDAGGLIACTRARSRS